MVEFTVAICTYNGETRLPNLLNKLLLQRQTEHFSWEVIVINNNSSDNTAKLVKHYQESWTAVCPLRYYFEPRQGLAYARRLAVKKARGKLLGFFDDDNYPSANWVSAAYSFGQHYPQAGAYGSQIRANTEIEPPENFQQIACFLGIIDRGHEPFRYDLLRRWLFPAGAGLVIRKQAWLESVPDDFWLTGVSGTSLTSKGEDIETLSYLRKEGWAIWHNPEMLITHDIPKHRLEKDYLIRLFQGVGLSRYPTRMLQFTLWWQPFGLLLYMLNDLRKLIFHCYKYRQALKTNMVARCQFELLLHSLFSPFYHWQQRCSKYKAGFSANNCSSKNQSFS